MEDKREETPQWEPMEVDAAGNVAEVMQGPKISPIEDKGPVVVDGFET